MRSIPWVLASCFALAICACDESGPAWDADADGDGVGGPWDCDDSDPAVHTKVTAYADAEGDGYGAGASVALCTAGALPAGYALAGGDCAPLDPLAWRNVDLVDRDGDGATVKEATPVCIGETPPEPYRMVARGNDCDDGDSAAFIWTVLYPDRDGDGVGGQPRSITCIGATVPSGWSRIGYDVNDLDPTAVSDPSADALARLLD